MRIRITSRPPGEAPEHVRDAWIGLTLDVLPAYGGRRRIRTMETLSGPRTFLGRVLAVLLGRTKVEDGYAVEAYAAVEELARHSPQAAAWWRSNVPHLLTPRRAFVFAAITCEECT